MGELYLKWKKNHAEPKIPESFRPFYKFGLIKAFFSYSEIINLLSENDKELFDSLEIEDYLAVERKKNHILNVLYSIGYNNIEDNPELHKQIVKSIELFKEGIVIQDDFYDKADNRHGTDSVFKRYGGEKATLIGEILISTAFLTNKDAIQKFNVPEQTKIQALAMFEETHRKINLGQLLDLELEKRSISEISEEDYFRMITLTTSYFIQFPLLLGSLLRKAPIEERKKLEEYGYYIGLAHQIRDDILDIIGDPEVLGKPFASDIRNKKKRLPLLYALNHIGRDDFRYIVKSFNQCDELSEQQVKNIVRIILNAGSIDYCKTRISKLCNRAVQCTHALTDSKTVKRLEDLAFWLTALEVPSDSLSIPFQSEVDKYQYAVK